MAKVTMSVPHRYAMLKSVEDQSEPHPNMPGFRRWKNGASMEIVAKSIDERYSHHHVRYLCQEMGWKFVDERPAKATTEALISRIDGIERLVLELGETQTQLGDAVRLIQDEMSAFKSAGEVREVKKGK